MQNYTRAYNEVYKSACIYTQNHHEHNSYEHWYWLAVFLLITQIPQVSMDPDDTIFLNCEQNLVKIHIEQDILFTPFNKLILFLENPVCI